MNRKFLYLTKVSLRKKFKTKWFAITNIILAVAIVLFLNINSIVSFFGGDFDSKTKIIVVDNNTDSYSLFEKNIESYASTINSDEEDVKVTVKKSEENAKESKDISNHFKINLDTANNWIKKWIEKGFLKRFDDKQIRNVDYILTEKYLEKLK